MKTSELPDWVAKSQDGRNDQIVLLQEILRRAEAKRIRVMLEEIESYSEIPEEELEAESNSPMATRLKSPYFDNLLLWIDSCEAAAADLGGCTACPKLEKCKVVWDWIIDRTDIGGLPSWANPTNEKAGRSKVDLSDGYAVSYIVQRILEKIPMLPG